VWVYGCYNFWCWFVQCLKTPPARFSFQNNKISTYLPSTTRVPNSLQSIQMTKGLECIAQHFSFWCQRLLSFFWLFKVCSLSSSKENNPINQITRYKTCATVHKSCFEFHHLHYHHFELLTLQKGKKSIRNKKIIILSIYKIQVILSDLAPDFSLTWFLFPWDDHCVQFSFLHLSTVGVYHFTRVAESPPK